MFTGPATFVVLLLVGLLLVAGALLLRAPSRTANRAVGGVRNCPRCGQPGPPQARFCARCGLDLNSDPPTTAPRKD